MTQVIKEAEVPTTAFEYDGTLDNSTNYFWRVMALEPAPSDWSATFSFQTEALLHHQRHHRGSNNSTMGVGGYRYRCYLGDRHPGPHLPDTPNISLPASEKQT